MKNDLTKQYSRFESYVVGLFQRRNEWALCLTQSLITRGQNTNNICEAGVKMENIQYLTEQRHILQ